MTITILDPMGAGLSLLATYFFTKASIHAWPISILAIVINTFLYFSKGIYGQVGLECFYLLTTLYGWFVWSQKETTKPLSITNIPKSIFWASLPIIGITIYMLSYMLKTFFDSNIAMQDATVTICSLTAQLMLCQKWIECWAIWFLVDAMIMVIHWSKGIPFHSAIHGIYLGMAILGYVRWKKQQDTQKKQQNTIPNLRHQKLIT